MSSKINSSDDIERESSCYFTEEYPGSDPELICDCCKKKITKYYVEILGWIFCEECIEDHRTYVDEEDWQ